MLHFFSSVGIIAGADGPTAIFISHAPLKSAAVLVLLLLALAGLVFWKKKP